MSLEVLSTGVYSLLVDRGRPRSRALGLPLGGAADVEAFTLGNVLLGNAPDALALEITLLGPTVRFTRETACVVFGAPFQLKSSTSQPRESGISFTSKPGEVLTIGGTEQGVRGYLCVKGGFVAKPLLKSCSAWKPVEKGQLLPARESRTTGRAIEFPLPVATSVQLIRVLPGPQRHWFGQEFFQQLYTVSPASNRMGLRLLGEAIPRQPGELTSEAVAPGAVQITNEGLPIVLGVDGQTIGGYPKPAHVITADLDKLAQLRPGTRVQFQEVTLETAQNAYHAKLRTLHEWLTRLRVS